VFFWYGLIPIAGASYRRYKWSKFRRHFDELRLHPLLDYSQYRQIGKDGGIFRFTGGFESITDEHTLWVRDENLTIPILLENTQSWLLPMQEDEGVPEAPERLKWNRLSTLTEGAKVFVGGLIKYKDNRLSFISTKENPLMVIFYDCTDTVLTDGIIRAGRTRNEYWNSITPVSLAVGAMSILYIAASFLNRPAFRLTVITAFIAIFVPILPMLPPGLLFTVLYRRLAWHARKYRSYRDLAKLPLRYLPPGQTSGILNTGEKYGYVQFDELPDSGIPLLLPEYPTEAKKTKWYVFGILDSVLDSAEGSGNLQIPSKSKDPFVSFGALPAEPHSLARRYSAAAYTTEFLAWVVLLAGVGINITFIMMILSLLWKL